MVNGLASIDAKRYDGNDHKARPTLADRPPVVGVDVLAGLLMPATELLLLGKAGDSNPMLNATSGMAGSGGFVLSLFRRGVRGVEGTELE